jgi:hypothetical protein
MQDETKTTPQDAQADERIAEFERLLAAALRRILTEGDPAIGAVEPDAGTPDGRADPMGVTP